MQKRIKHLIWAGLFTVILISCQKNEEGLSINEDFIEKEAEIEVLLSGLDALSEEVIEDQLKVLKSAPLTVSDEDDSCPVVTYYRNSEPRKIVIDFGTECEGKDGKIRSGKIIITSSSFENMMATRTKTFENFSVEGRGIDGTITKTITLVRENHARVAEITEELTITTEKNTAQRTGTLTRTHELNRIFDRKDDLVKKWGEVITIWEDNGTVSKTILEENPLVFKYACRQIVSGILYVTRGEESWSIDYGQGECDNKAIVNRDGVIKEIRIGRFK